MLPAALAARPHSVLQIQVHPLTSPFSYIFWEPNLTRCTRSLTLLAVVVLQAERWNGRHAMFGWVLIVATGYAKAHGLIPDPEVALNLKEWGTLSILAGPQTISNEVNTQVTVCTSPLQRSRRGQATDNAAQQAMPGSRRLVLLRTAIIPRLQCR